MVNCPQNWHVKNMYNQFSPFPGRFIKLLNEDSVFKKSFFLKLACRREFNHEKSYAVAKFRFGKLCPPPEASFSFLDAGCGTGERTIMYGLAFPNARVIGVDFSRSSIEYANSLKRLLEVDNVDFFVRDVAGDSISDLGNFLCINCAGVLHHIREPLVVLEKFREIMRDDGVLSVFLYANSGQKYREKQIRDGVRLIFPSDEQLENRIGFLKKLGINREMDVFQEPISSTRIFLRKLMIFIRNAKDLGYLKYTREPEDTHTYDAFVNPIVKYYNSDSIKDLFSRYNFELFSFSIGPSKGYYKKFNKHLLPYVDGLDIYESMKIKEKFLYNDVYNLIFTKKHNSDDKGLS